MLRLNSRRGSRCCERSWCCRTHDRFSSGTTVALVPLTCLTHVDSSVAPCDWVPDSAANASVPFAGQTVNRTRPTPSRRAGRRIQTAPDCAWLVPAGRKVTYQVWLDSWPPDLPRPLLFLLSLLPWLKPAGISAVSASVWEWTFSRPAAVISLVAVPSIPLRSLFNLTASLARRIRN